MQPKYGSGLDQSDTIIPTTFKKKSTGKMYIYSDINFGLTWWYKEVNYTEYDVILLITHCVNDQVQAQKYLATSVDKRVFAK